MDREHGVIIDFPGQKESCTPPYPEVPDDEDEILEFESADEDDIDFYEDDLDEYDTAEEDDDFDSDVTDDQTMSEKETFRLSDVQLPSGLQESYMKTLLLAGVVVIASLALLIVFKAVQSLFGFVLAGWGFYKAIALKIDYSEGKIREVSTVCASVTFVPGVSYTKLVFREDSDDDSPPRYYEFKMPGSQKNKNFQQNYVYVLYFRESDPKNLLGYVQL